MTEHKEHNEIRYLLSRWYEGGTTPDEERRLSEFFATAGTLPPDLENERVMFQAIDAVDEQEVKIPEELARRIDNAIEEEMARERETTSATSRFHRWMIAAGTVAASLVAVLMVHTFVVKDHDRVRPQTQLALGSPASSVTSAPDTAAFIVPGEINTDRSASSEMQVNTKRRPASSSQKAKADRTQQDKISPTESGLDEDMYLSEAEEQQLIADNYRVVRDEREADAILSSVFVRLEGSVVEEDYRISDISAEYEMEMTKLYN